MFSYLLIALELSMVSFVYWLAFIYQPKPSKPLKLAKNLWGHYDERAKHEAQFRKEEAFEKLGSALTIKPPFLR